LLDRSVIPARADHIDVEALGPESSPTCYIYRADTLPQRSVFPTPASASLQVGYVVHSAGHEIARHLHARPVSGARDSTEVLVVMRGRCELDVYDEDRRFIATRELRTGDVMVMLRGGHGFRMLEDTVFLEIKPGPYRGEEKEHF